MEQKIRSFDDYLNATHRLGRTFSVLAIIVMLGIPITICTVFDIMPSFMMVLSSSIGLMAFLAPATLIELFSYTPMLGAGGSYVAFVTGNVTNLKLPCCLMCTNTAGVEPDSEEGEIISTVAICISSFVTTIIIVAAIILIRPLTPLLSSPVLEPAFSNIIPALFGSLGFSMIASSNVKGLWKAALLPLVAVIILTLTVGFPIGFEGVFILILFPVIAGIAKKLYAKGSISVEGVEDYAAEEQAR